MRPVDYAFVYGEGSTYKSACPRPLASLPNQVKSIYVGCERPICHHI